MTTSMRPTTALVISALAATSALVSSCSSNSDTRPAPAPSPTISAPPVSEHELGLALTRLVFHSSQPPSPNAGACLASSVTKAGLSVNAQRYIVTTRGDDQGAVAAGVRTINAADADLLLSPPLRDAVDRCVDAAAPLARDQAYAPAEPAGKPAPRLPDLTPKYPIAADTGITSASQLTPGVVSIFSSYARDERQRRTYVAAGECLAGVILGAGFSQQALRFLAGGAPIGAGSVADYLPTDEDKKVWRSQGFVTALTDCTATVKPGA
ncbi:hypothetical protein [Amycolatopsis sp. CA-230715]|uniref:hypothetical protein n=1 Tax=Amycolatopsis sp. CA-230715 TaxID=2745196 RepID=UPI001C02040B|nr:hypothetical protein [Amycolatopsis sp. CA-230715]QWF85779.1 hypothetical protein HUW46_09259 [Amycolatopsis sp. CA-230715]